MLQTTALVNEAYLRLLDCSRVNWRNRAHFLAISAQLMRRILVDYARSHQSLKRGGEAQRVSLVEVASLKRFQNKLSRRRVIILASGFRLLGFKY